MPTTKLGSTHPKIQGCLENMVGVFYKCSFHDTIELEGKPSIQREAKWTYKLKPNVGVQIGMVVQEGCYYQKEKFIQLIFHCSTFGLMPEQWHIQIMARVNWQSKNSRTLARTILVWQRRGIISSLI